MDIVTLALAKKYADSINSGITNITTKNNKLIFTLQNGKTIEVPLTDLVDNVVTEETLLDKLKDYIKNTDWASSSKGGVIKTDYYYGTDSYNGTLFATTKTYNDYEKGPVSLFIGKGTLENAITGKNLETANNKVTFVDEDSTDTQYPSAKAMYKVSNKLDTLKDEVLDTGEASDSFIHIEDSAISELQELSVDGVCEQEAANLLDMSDFEMGGMWKGESVNTYLYRINNANNPIQVIPSGEYIIDVLDWGNFKGLRFGIHSCSEDGTFIDDSGWKQLKNNVPCHVTIRDDTKKIKLIFSGSTTSEIVETSSSENIDSYESAKDWLRGAKIEFKPTGGPNPNHPQEIKTITGSLNVTSCNKNLLETTLETAEISGIKITKNKNNTYILNGTATENLNIYWRNNDFTLLKGNYYMGLGTPSENLNLFLTSSTGNDVLMQPANKSYIAKTLTNDTKYSMLRSYISAGQSFSNVTFYPMICKELPFNYIEHQDSSITANLPEGEFIGKIDDTYKDELDIVYNETDGNWHKILKKKISKIIYDGSESGWWQHTNGFFAIQRKGALYGPIKSNNFMSGFNDKKAYCYATDYISIKYDEMSTLDEFKNWLSTHNTEIYYRVQPYEVDLGVCDMPLTYNEITNIFTNSNLLPQINVKCYRNFTKTIQNLQINNDTLKNELLSIENRLTALENANTTTTNTEPTIESEGTE